MTIDYFSLGHPLAGLRSRFAVKARRGMFEHFMSVMHPTERSRVLDLGVTPDQSLPESNFFEKLYPFKENLTAASIEDAGFLEHEYPGIRFVRIAPGPLPFGDNEFDILFCSAVVEHVGDRTSQGAFIWESLRVTKRFFFTTPNRLFPMEFHTLLPLLHWLPQKTHQAALRALGKDFWANTENLNLLTPRKLLALFPPCRSLSMFRYRLFGWPSNLVVYGSKE